MTMNFIGYEQHILRTMFFKREETMTIDGKNYTVSPAAHFDHYKCKEVICGIFMHISKDQTENLDKTNYLGWKKDLVSKLKEWDKYYVKHGKNINPELSAIHTSALHPLINLMESNNNYYNFNQLLKTDPELPEFRFKALEDKYIEHMTKICDILTAYPIKATPDANHGPLETPYDIAKMLTVLKTKDWRDIPSLEYYMTPLSDQFDKVT